MRKIDQEQCANPILMNYIYILTISSELSSFISSLLPDIIALCGSSRTNVVSDTRKQRQQHSSEMSLHILVQSANILILVHLKAKRNILIKYIHVYVYSMIV